HSRQCSFISSALCRRGLEGRRKLDDPSTNCDRASCWLRELRSWWSRMKNALVLEGLTYTPASSALRARAKVRTSERSTKAEQRSLTQCRWHWSKQGWNRRILISSALTATQCQTTMRPRQLESSRCFGRTHGMFPFHL